MERNKLNGPLQYGTLREGYGLRVSQVADRTLRVYWANQIRSSLLWQASLGDAAYIAPTGWPVEGEVLRMPKVVNFIYAKHSNPVQPSQRQTAWTNIIATVKSTLEAAHDNFFVRDVRADQAASQGIGNFLRHFTPLDGDVSDGFIGADVLNLIYYQGFGITFANIYETYGGDISSPFLIAQAAATYAADYDKFAAAAPLFRRNVGWVHLDDGIIEPLVGTALPSSIEGESFSGDYFFGGTGWSGISLSDADDIWQDITSFYLDRLPRMIDGTGQYCSGRPLSAFDWEWKGQRSFETASAATIISEIEAHFDL